MWRWIVLITLVLHAGHGALSTTVGDLTSLLSKTMHNPEEDSEEIEFLMPQVQPNEEDIYLCVSMKLDEVSSYITGFKPRASSGTVHHMLLFGCGEPGTNQKTWDCGHGGHSIQYTVAGVCAREQQILYAWAQDAPDLKLPDGVGFEVGGHSSAHFLVLQVHYRDVTRFLPPISSKDSSGVALTVQKTPTPRKAGVYVIGSAGIIPARSTVFLESLCSYTERPVLYPFAFRTHTHKLGKVVSGYRIRDGHWTEIGRKNPQLPQMFYDVTSPGLNIVTGDILAARCTMKNEQFAAVRTGSTHDDEMCNFYIMYYVEGDNSVQEKLCASLGPPMGSWATSSSARFMNLAAVPSTASNVPETGEILTATSPHFSRANQINVLQSMLDSRRGRIINNVSNMRWQSANNGII